METANKSNTNTNLNLTQNDLIKAENRSFKRRGSLHQKVRKIRYLQSLARLTQVSWKQRFASMLLIFTIYSTTVFASPNSARTMVVTADEYKKSVQFAMATNDFGGSFVSSIYSDVYGFFFKLLSRKPKPDQVIILPNQDEKGTLTVVQGETVNFTAIGLLKNEPVSGLQFRWSITDIGRNRQPRPLNNGNFVAKAPGNYLISAESDGGQAQVNVTVVGNEGFFLKKLLNNEKSEGNDKGKQQLNDLRTKKVIVSREISTKNEYKNDEEQKINLEGKKKRQDAELKADEKRKHPPTPTVEKSPTPGGPNADSEEVSYSNVNYSETEKSEKVEAPRRPEYEDGWDGSNWWTFDAPENQIGDPPGNAPDAGAGNGNFHFSAPVVALPGRGMDINLSLHYNSRLWNKSGNNISYDNDKGFPGPGWTFGFGKMVYTNHLSGCILEDADGTRHSYTGTASSWASGATFSGHTTDGSFIDYGCTVYYGWASYGWAKLPNGTTVSYYTAGPDNAQIFPTQITDAQNNYINITYINAHGPYIQTVTDTMGRVTTFNYDSSNRLVSVAVPGFNNGPARIAVRLHYTQMNLSYSFNGLTPDTPTNSPMVLDSIYYPGTNTGYWFGDNDSYSSYGMIQKVVEQRGMSWSGSNNNDQGTVTPGTMTKLAVYHYLTSGALNDAPTYDTLTESWDGMDTAAPQTVYSVNKNDYHYDGYSNSPCYTTKVIQPNGTISKQYSYRTPGAWTDGLIFADETLKVVNGTEVVTNSSIVSWQQGAYDTGRPALMIVTDERQQTASTTFTYGSVYNQVISKKEYDYNNGALKRETRSTFENNPAYTNRHLFNLVKSNEIYDGAGNRVAKTDYEYDNNAVVTGPGNPNLKAATGVIMHNYQADPFTTQTQDGSTCINGGWNYSECYYEGQPVWVYTSGGWEDYCHLDCSEYEQVSAYDPTTIYRGNVTKITSYADAGNPTPTQVIVTTRQYDITGNVVAESASCCEQKTYDYTINTQFAYPTTFSRGTADNSLRNTSSSTYDFWTGLVLTSTDPNGKTDSTTYDVNTLRPIQSNSSTGAYAQTFYDDSAMTITSEAHSYETQPYGGNLVGKSIKYLNGIGKVKRVESLGENGIWDRVDTKYNNLGQVWKQSNPYRIGETVYETETVYDFLGRTVQVIAPDNSMSQVVYNEAQRPDSASSLPGETVRQIDAWGRERWSRTNVLGQMVEVVEPNPEGNGSVLYSGSLVTNYEYDITNNLTKTIQGSSPNQQIREFRYDTLGRITRQKLAEQSATIRDDGVFVGEGGANPKWSSAVLAYDSRSNILQSMDARGVKTNFSYQVGSGDDPLNRLQSVSYDSSVNSNIATVPNVNYYYETNPAKDRDRLLMVTNGNVSDENVYDDEGRVITTTRKLINKGNFTMTTNYTYDSLSRVTSIQYPAQTGLPGNPTKTVTNAYDIASRMATLSFNGQQQASNIVYNAASQTTSINIGATGANQIQEQYTFDPVTGLLVNQKAVNANNTNQKLIDLTYDYARNNSLGNTNSNWKTGALTKIFDNLNHNKDREYQFDALGRLRFAKGGVNGALSTQEYQYDRFGNRTVVNVGGYAADNSPMVRDGLANLAYNATNNRITTSGFEYDSAGNQTKAYAEDGTTLLKFEYDAANRMIAVRKDSDNTLWEAQEFGVGNDRISQFNYANNQRTYYYGSIEYTESNNSGSLIWSKSYVYFGDSILSTITNNGSSGETVEYNHPDRLGTKVVTNQQAGTSIEQNALPFGTALGAESSGATAKRFTSYERSGRTGLDYAQNRTYDSKQGRFTQVDPIGMGSSSLIAPQTLNLYSYCGNDPINRTDPSGLFWGKLFKIFKIIVGVLMAVAAVLCFQLQLVPLGWALIAGSASIFASTFGNKTIQNIVKWVNVAVSAYQIHNRPVQATAPTFFKQGKRVEPSWLSKIIPGVGAIPSFFASRQQISHAQAVKEVEKIKKLAIAKLTNNAKCKEALSHNGIDALDALNDLKGSDYNYLYVEETTSNDYYAWTWSRVEPYISKGSITFYNGFFKGLSNYQFYGGGANGGIGDFGLKTIEERRLLTFLHEIGHLTGRYVHSGYVPGPLIGFGASMTDAEVNQYVYQNCF